MLIKREEQQKEEKKKKEILETVIFRDVCEDHEQCAHFLFFVWAQQQAQIKGISRSEPMNWRDPTLNYRSLVQSKIEVRYKMSSESEA